MRTEAEVRRFLRDQGITKEVIQGIYGQKQAHLAGSDRPVYLVAMGAVVDLVMNDPQKLSDFMHYCSELLIESYTEWPLGIIQHLMTSDAGRIAVTDALREKGELGGLIDYYLTMEGVEMLFDGEYYGEVTIASSGGAYIYHVFIQ
jgi:hypothetical protein